jgi:hypothetical protein
MLLATLNHVAFALCVLALAGVCLYLARLSHPRKEE